MNNVITEVAKSTQKLNEHVFEFFKDWNEKMEIENGKDIYDSLTEQEAIMLCGVLGQVARTYAVLVSRHVPEDMLSDEDKEKIVRTVETTENLIDTCAKEFKGGRVVHMGEDEEDDADDMSKDDLLDDIRKIPKNELVKILKDGGLDRKEIAWILDKVENDNWDGPEDETIGRSILKKLSGMN